MEIKILDTDLFFYESPDAGEKDCICSRCKELITEDQVPLRMAVGNDNLKTVSPDGESKSSDAGNGKEFRLCESCMKKEGVIIS